MGKRKLRLSVHRKNEEGKKKAMKTLQVEHPPQPDVIQPPVKEQDCLSVSIPLHFFTESCVSSLRPSRMRKVVECVNKMADDIATKKQVSIRSHRNDIATGGGNNSHKNDIATGRWH